jgi:hypothetical protein
MLIRVVLAVNDFIFLAGFSEKNRGEYIMIDISSGRGGCIRRGQQSGELALESVSTLLFCRFLFMCIF